LASIVGRRYIQRGGGHKAQGPCLIVANHQSTWETVAELILFPDVAVVTKRELLRIPVMGWFLNRSPMILIDHAEGAKGLREMVQARRAAIAEDRRVLILLEGSRMPVGTTVIFRRGVELLDRTLGVPRAACRAECGMFLEAGPQPEGARRYQCIAAGAHRAWPECRTIRPDGPSDLGRGEKQVRRFSDYVATWPGPSFEENSQ
jgi:1-acyl-sn-glycerol-3-phosphate acyltransferase